jgi:hypothetical protein
VPTLDRSRAFAEKHLTAPDGTPFSFDGRDWLLEQIWRPLCEWKLWPRSSDPLCDDCAKQAGTFVAEHKGRRAHDGCPGLEPQPQLIVAADLRRQSGKTMGASGLLLSRVFLDAHESIVLLAGSEDQVKRLFDDHYARQVLGSPALSKHATVRGTRISTDKKSELIIVPTTISAVGGTHTAVVLDECRIVPPDVAVAMLPTMFARGGWQCPLFHVRTHNGVEDKDAPRKCGVCGRRTEPWYGRALMLSSAGELSDSGQDWFFEFKEFYKTNPHPNVHVFSSQESLNPKVSSKMVGVVAEVFGALDSTREFAEIETSNRSMKRGQPFMSDIDIKRCIDKRIINLASCAAPSFGFLDTSETTDKTSLVILSDLAREGTADPWDVVTQTRLDVWIPKETEAGVIDSVAVEAHLENILAMFTGLVRLKIDTRGRPWAIAMFNRLRRKSAKLARYDKTDRGERNAGFGKLWQRMVTRPDPKIVLQDHAEQTRELKFARKKRDASGDVVVCDPNTNREKYHLDITESVAMCCYLIAEHQMKRAASGGQAHILSVLSARRTRGDGKESERKNAGRFSGDWY